MAASAASSSPRPGPGQALRSEDARFGDLAVIDLDLVGLRHRPARRDCNNHGGQRGEQQPAPGPWPGLGSLRSGRQRLLQRKTPTKLQSHRVLRFGPYAPADRLYSRVFHFAERDVAEPYTG